MERAVFITPAGFSPEKHDSYREYLQNSEYVKVVGRTIEDNGRIVAASVDQVGRKIGGLEDGIERFREEALRCFQSQHELLDYGFTDIVCQLTSIGDSLEKIANYLENPSLTWAYEQFNTSRDLYRRRLFAEALVAVDLAISGSQAQVGYPYDHRFHLLKGTIFLGQFGAGDASHVDAAAARSAFLEAAKLARHDFPEESARAFALAAHASFALGEITEAIKYIDNARSIDNDKLGYQRDFIMYSLAGGEAIDDFVDEIIHLMIFLPNAEVLFLKEPVFAEHEFTINRIIDAVVQVFQIQRVALDVYLEKMWEQSDSVISVVKEYTARGNFSYDLRRQMNDQVIETREKPAGSCVIDQLTRDVFQRMDMIEEAKVSPVSLLGQLREECARFVRGMSFTSQEQSNKNATVNFWPWIAASVPLSLLTFVGTCMSIITSPSETRGLGGGLETDPLWQNPLLVIFIVGFVIPGLIVVRNRGRTQQIDESLSSERQMVETSLDAALAKVEKELRIAVPASLEREGYFHDAVRQALGASR